MKVLITSLLICTAFLGGCGTEQSPNDVPIAQVAKASVMPVDSSDGMEQVEPTVSNPLAAPSGSFEEI